MYRIVFSRSQRLAEITVSGFWTAEDAVDFCADLRGRLGDLPKSPGGYSILCDLDAGMVAPAQAMANLAAIMANPDFADLRARRIAIYAASAMKRRQIGRLAEASDRIAVFEDRAAAMSWLHSERAKAA